MNRGTSLWLDLLRVWATLAVVLSHLAYPRFTRGDLIQLREWNIGSDGVILFFVISGIVIAYAAERDATPGRFAFNRLTRLWSVLLPALLLTYVFDRVGLAIDASAYPVPFYREVSLAEMLARGLSFSNEWYLTGRARLGSNGPLWSLSYEAAYYGLFGIAVFVRGWRRVALLGLAALLVGPRVLLLMPAWLVGVWLWQRLKAGPEALPALLPALLLAFGAPAAYVAAVGSGVPEVLRALTLHWFGAWAQKSVMLFSDEVFWNTLVAGLAALHILGMARLLASLRGEWPWVRWFAGASFSIYVTHYPALHLLDAAAAEDLPGRDLVLFAGSIAVGLVFAELFERRLGALRGLIRRRFGLEACAPSRAAL